MMITNKCFWSNRMCSFIEFLQKQQDVLIGLFVFIFVLKNLSKLTDLFFHILLFLPCNLERASDWKLDAPDWTGRLRLVVKGNQCSLNIEDKQTGKLFAKCFIDQYPGVCFSFSSSEFKIKRKTFLIYHRFLT